jgi:hypothetical protein
MMISGVEPLTDPDEAVICGLPRSTALASPELLTDANFISEELQVTEDVMSATLPSVNVPLAANCWFFPTDIVVFAGETAIDVKVVNGFVEDCEPPQPLNAKTLSQSAIETTNLLHSERIPSFIIRPLHFCFDSALKLPLGVVTLCLYLSGVTAAPRRSDKDRRREDHAIRYTPNAIHAPSIQARFREVLAHSTYPLVCRLSPPRQLMPEYIGY